MVRPCFLVVDREYPGMLSTRKLVLETAKYNVITAYSAKEAIHTLEAFPNVCAVVMDTHIPDMPCTDLIQRLQAIKPGIPVIATQTAHPNTCEGANYVIPFYSPDILLATVAKVVPDETNELRKQEQRAKEAMDERS